ncbi:MAG TPA: hypothetical protein VL283_05625 [Candidatus Baltobacteraceae bacterium]|nr:hypothetical protein [Candidatus Baltobacteraceae bacterium]
MLDANDLKLIGEEMSRVIDDNLMPRIEDLITEELAPIKATMVTKSYLDDKLADLKSDLVANDRKLEKKTDILVDTLVERRALKPSDVDRLEQARVFPRTAP